MARLCARILLGLVCLVLFVAAAVGVVAVPGLIPAVVVVGVVVGVATGFNAQGVLAGAASTDGVDGRAATTVSLAAGGATVAGCLVVAGLAVLAGPAAWAIVVSLMVLAAPAAWWWLQQHPRRGADDAAVTRGETPTAPPVQSAPALEALTTAELCLAWQRSHFALLDLPAGPDRCEVARVRECLLDELERRDHDGFARWLHSDARPGSNPGRYLAADRSVREPPGMTGPV